MEETKWLTKTKIFILIGIILIIAVAVGIIFIRRNNLKKEYIQFEKQLEYAAPNYLLKEKITLNEYEWREIGLTDLLKQKLVTNKRSSDCQGYVIAQGLENIDNTVDSDIEEIENIQEESESNETSSEEVKEKVTKTTNNITYKAYITCKKIYTTTNYGTRPTNGEQNKEETQTQKDTEKPKIELFGDKEITLTVGDKYEELGAVATDNVDGDITKSIKITGSVDTTKKGTYTIKYTVVDSSNNKSSKTRTVIVEEKKEEIKEVKEPEKEQPNENQNTNNNTNSNTTNNSNTNNTQPVYVDTISPIITFNNDSLYQTICTANRADTSLNGIYGYVARDNVDGDITSRVRISGDTGIINNPGTYNLYYEVSDNAGNTARATKQFNVKDCSNTLPTPTTEVSVTSVTVSPNNITLSVGNTYSLSATVIPSNATNKSVTYSSTNPSVASVDSNGNIKAISSGSTTIKATSNNGKVGVCRITVK